MKPIFNQHHLACFVAVTCKESGAWLNCLPSTAIGCRLDNDSFCLAVSIRLRLSICTPHRCRCGSRVDEYGLHPLSCHFSIGRLLRHTALNDVIHHSFQSAGIITLLEPAGLDRGDGNRPDGINLFPYARGKSLVWDAACTDTFSPSNMIRSAIQARAAANEAESRKRIKYASLSERSDFQPIAVETSGVLGESTLVFPRNLGNRVGQGRHTGANMADTAYLVGYCERQRHLNCNVLSPFVFATRVMTSQCAIMIMFGCRFI